MADTLNTLILGLVYQPLTFPARSAGSSAAAAVDQLGVVHLRGTFTMNSGGATPVLLGTLPAAARPSSTITVVAYKGTTAMQLTINTDGTITSPASVFVGDVISIAGITY